MLANQERDLKICDFGTARDLTSHSMSNAIGTIRWMAPEVIQGRNYNEKCDVYSWTIICWELFARKKPYGNYCRTAIVFNVPNGKRPPFLQNFSDQIKSLLTVSWANDPNERPSMDQIEQTMNTLSRCHVQNSELILKSNSDHSNTCDEDESEQEFIYSS